MSALLQSALWYASIGWRVFPLVEGDKEPITRHGHLDATLDPERIRRWWSQHPDARIGVWCRASGLIVVDVDGAAGLAKLAELESQHGPLPRTLVQRSGGSGGLHIVMRDPHYDPQRDLSKLVSDVHGNIGGKGVIDVKANGYVVVAPSGTYQWLEPFDYANPPAVPAAWIPLIMKAPSAEALPAPAPMSGDLAARVAAGRAELAEYTARAGTDMSRRVAEVLNGRGGESCGTGNVRVGSIAYTIGTVAPTIGADAAVEIMRGTIAQINGPSAHSPERLHERARQQYEAGASRAATEGVENAAVAGVFAQPNPPQPSSSGASAPSTAPEYGGDLLAYLGEDDPGEDPDAWLIAGVMPAGSPTVIGGLPKTCKTFLAEHMAISLAAGIDWLGRRVQRCRVLILACEDTLRETRRRIWRLARGLGLDPRELNGWLRLDTKTPFFFSRKDDVDKMRRTIVTFRPALIIVDSLSRTHDGDENSKKEMSIVTSTWGALCQEFDLTLAPIHHFVKNDEGTLIQRLRGTGDITALVRHIIGVAKQPDGTTELSFEGNLHPLPDPFVVRMIDAVNERGQKVIRFEPAGSAMAMHIERIDRAILTYVASVGTDGATGADLEKAVQGKGAVIRERLQHLLKTGKLLRPAKRYYVASSASGPEIHATLLGGRLIAGDS